MGSTSSLINLLVNLFVGLAIGANVLTARYHGAKQEKDLSETVHTTVALSLVCGTGLAIIGVLVARPILVMMDTPDERSATGYNLYADLFFGNACDDAV